MLIMPIKTNKPGPKPSGDRNRIGVTLSNRGYESLEKLLAHGRVNDSRLTLGEVVDDALLARVKALGL